MELSILQTDGLGHVAQPDEGIHSEQQLLASLLITMGFEVGSGANAITLHIDLDGVDRERFADELAALLDYFEPKDH